VEDVISPQLVGVVSYAVALRSNDDATGDSRCRKQMTNASAQITTEKSFPINFRFPVT